MQSASVGKFDEFIILGAVSFLKISTQTQSML
jgi:hypothetical protein